MAGSVVEGQAGVMVAQSRCSVLSGFVHLGRQVTELFVHALEERLDVLSGCLKHGDDLRVDGFSELAVDVAQHTRFVAHDAEGALVAGYIVQRKEGSLVERKGKRLGDFGCVLIGLGGVHGLELIVIADETLDDL